MNYAMYGDKQAQEVIVAIPALGERKEMFLPLVAQLPTYRWFIFDLPGSHLKKEGASIYCTISSARSIPRIIRWGALFPRRRL